MRTLIKGILSIFTILCNWHFYNSNTDVKHLHIRNGMLKNFQDNEHFVDIFAKYIYQFLGDPFSSIYNLTLICIYNNT